MFQAGIFLGKSIVVTVTGENEFSPTSLILDLEKRENFAKTVIENLENDECVSVKKITKEFMNFIEDKKLQFFFKIKCQL